jgi:hypothetical protein
MAICLRPHRWLTINSESNFFVRQAMRLSRAVAMFSTPLSNWRPQPLPRANVTPRPHVRCKLVQYTPRDTPEFELC